MDAKTQEPATHQPPCPFAGTLRTYDWRERGCCCIEPATPRETALAAPTGETVPGLWDVMVSMALKPRQVCVSATDEAQVAALLAARVPAPSAPQDITNHPTVERLTRERDAANEYVRHFVQRLGVTGPSAGANVAEVALCKLDELLAARVPAPIAEPEIMALARRVIEAWESPVVSVAAFDKSLTVLRDALAEFDHYSTGGRDAS